MLVKQAEVIVGGTSQTSKMPGRSWSTSARRCVVGGKLRGVKGSTCSHCYALQGAYNWDSYENAADRRWDALQRALSSAASKALFIRAMVTIASRQRHFRWHDSGDIHGVEHLRMIVAIAKAAPNTLFWLPTREYGLVAQYLDSGETIPDNLVIRISAPMIAQNPRALKCRFAGVSGITFSTVGLSEDNPEQVTLQCPSRRYQNTCGPCRACWSPNALVIDYPLHGYEV